MQYAAQQVLLSRVLARSISLTRYEEILIDRRRPTRTFSRRFLCTGKLAEGININNYLKKKKKQQQNSNKQLDLYNS